MRIRSTAAPGSIFVPIATVNHLLFRIIAKDASDLLEAGLNGSHGSKGSARSTASLRFYRGYKTFCDGIVLIGNSVSCVSCEVGCRANFLFFLRTRLNQSRFLFNKLVFRQVG